MKNKFKIIALLTIIPLISFSQEKTNAEKNRIERSNYFFNYTLKDYSKAALYAKQDIENGNLTLYTSGFLMQRNDEKAKKKVQFTKRYKVTFSGFGMCLAPNYKCVAEYNKQIFDYLTETYGKKWMQKIDKYVIGFDEWKLAFDKK